MQCVALGAALQTALLTEVECLTCQTINQVHADCCKQCNGPLYGADRAQCPQCHTLAAVGAETCQRFGRSLLAEETAMPSLTSTTTNAMPVANAERCPQ